MARHDASARDGNGYAKDGMGSKPDVNGVIIRYSNIQVWRKTYGRRRYNGV